MFCAHRESGNETALKLWLKQTGLTGLFNGFVRCRVQLFVMAAARLQIQTIVLNRPMLSRPVFNNRKSITFPVEARGMMSIGEDVHMKNFSRR